MIRLAVGTFVALSAEAGEAIGAIVANTAILANDAGAIIDFVAGRTREAGLALANEAAEGVLTRAAVGTLDPRATVDAIDGVRGTREVTVG